MTDIEYRTNGHGAHAPTPPAAAPPVDVAVSAADVPATGAEAKVAPAGTAPEGGRYPDSSVSGPATAPVRIGEAVGGSAPTVPFVLEPTGTGALAQTATEVITADPGQRFAPGNPHASRLRGWRGLLVALIVLLAAALLGWALHTVVLSSTLQASGQIQADQSAQLNMAVTGPIASLTVVPGQRVKAGEVLATQDASSAQAKLAADQAALTADQAALAQLQAGPSAAVLAQLQAAVTQASVGESAAAAKLAQTEQTTAASVRTAQSKITQDQALLSADETRYNNDAPACASATPPSYCGSDERQVQVDQANLRGDQQALTTAETNQQSQISAAQSAVTQAGAAVTSAQAAQSAGSQPATAQQLSTAQAAIQKEQSAITADQQDISETQLSAPFSGVVASVGGTVGDIATSQGVRQPTAAAPVSSQSSTGIQLFPQSPEQQGAAAPTTAPLVQLDSLGTKLVVEVPETAVGQVRVGQRATASLPALSDASFPATVRQILPTTVSQNSKVYVLVELTAAPGTIRRLLRTHPSAAASGQLAGFTVNVSF